MNAEILIPIVIAIIAAAPGALSLWKQAKLDREKAALDREKQPQLAIHEGITASQAAAQIIRQYSDEIKGMRTDLSILSDEVTGLKKQVAEKDMLISEWQVGIKRLIAQLASLNQIPVWEPRPRQTP